LTLAEFQQFSSDIESDIFDCVTLEASVNARTATGGTARSAVEKELGLARQALKEG
jgi:argininosuccinate lyase